MSKRAMPRLFECLVPTLAMWTDKQYLRNANRVFVVNKKRWFLLVVTLDFSPDQAFIAQRD